MIADKPVNDITASDVLQTVKAVLQRAPVTALRLRGRIEQVLAAAQALGHIDPDRRNPAVWRGHMDKLLPARPRVEHLRTLPYAELPRFMAELRALRRDADGANCIAAYALEFAILTAARSGEVRLARWSEIDWQQRLWSLPAERMKSNREHWVPLSDAALTILKVMQELRAGEWVFSDDGRKPIGDKRVGRLLERLQRSCTAQQRMLVIEQALQNANINLGVTVSGGLPGLPGTSIDMPQLTAAPTGGRRDDGPVLGGDPGEDGER